MTTCNSDLPHARRQFLQQMAAAGAALPVARSAAQAQGREKKRIRVGQIGVGHAHANKLSVYRASDEYEVVGIVEPDTELRVAASADPLYRDLPFMTQEQLLNTPGLDAVLVETEVRDLLDVAQACVQAGKHIHLDKPAGESLPQFRQIVQSARRQGLIIQLGYMYRYNPGMVMLHQFLEKGWLGDVFEVHAVMSKVISPPQRRRLAEYPGGLMFELGCHIIDLVVGVLGQPMDVQPFAQHASSQPDNLLDNMLAVFSYDRAIATVKTSGMEVEGFARRHLCVCGTEGTFHIQPLDNPAVRVAFSRDHAPYQRGYQDVSLPKYTRYVADAADMAAILRGEREPRYGYEHDLAVQETVLRACGQLNHTSVSPIPKGS